MMLYNENGNKILSLNSISKNKMNIHILILINSYLNLYFNMHIVIFLYYTLNIIFITKNKIMA